MSKNRPPPSPANESITEADAYGEFAAEVRDRNVALRRELAAYEQTIAERDREIESLRRRLARTSPARIVALRKAG